jgi:hypothetical protein
MTGDQVPDPLAEPGRRGGADLQAEPAQNTPQAHLDVEQLDCTSLRAVNSARTSWAAGDLQCTGLNQPSRIN